MKLSPPSRVQAAVLAGIAVLLLLMTVVVPSTLGFEVTHPDTPQGPTVQGRVIEVLSRETIPSERGPIERERLSVDIDGLQVLIERTRAEGDIGQLDVEAGDRVLLSRLAGPDGDTYYIVDRVRQTTLLWLLVAFVLAVVATGRLVGVASLVGLAASMLVLVRFIVPGILSGHSPVLIAVVGALTIMASTLFLAHGVNRKTVVALIGTAVALCFTAVLATVTIAAAQLTGVASEDAAVLQVLSAGQLSASGLLLGGIIIGALGVLDDVTVAQSSAVFELHGANPFLSPLDLYRRAMNVGRDHIAATVNTLVLAYAGASLPLLMLLAVQGEPLTVQLNREFIAIEVVRSLVGSIGLVAAVPLTTAIAALAAARVAAGDRPASPDSPEMEAALH
ncbi:MAG: YibE/F family protein [Dehalococcoidia bacterium]